MEAVYRITRYGVVGSSILNGTPEKDIRADVNLSCFLIRLVISRRSSSVRGAYALRITNKIAKIYSRTVDIIVNYASLRGGGRDSSLCLYK